MQKMAANSDRAPALHQGQALRVGSCFEQQKTEDGSRSVLSLCWCFQVLWEPVLTGSVPFTETVRAAVVTAMFTLFQWVVRKVFFSSVYLSGLFKKKKTSPPVDHMTLLWLNLTLSLAPALESSEVGRSKVNLMRKNVARVRHVMCNTWEHQMIRGALLQNTRKRATLIAKVLTLMSCCITVSDRRGRINSTWWHEIMWAAVSVTALRQSHQQKTQEQKVEGLG